MSDAPTYLPWPLPGEPQRDGFHASISPVDVDRAQRTLMRLEWSEYAPFLGARGWGCTFDGELYRWEASRYG